MNTTMFVIALFVFVTVTVYSYNEGRNEDIERMLLRGAAGWGLILAVLATSQFCQGC